MTKSIYAKLTVASLATALMATAAPSWAAGKRIGMASREITNDYNRGIIAGAQKVIEAAGDTMIVANGEADPRKHNENIENLINSHVDGLIIQLGDAQQLAPEVAKAKAAGIPVVTTSVGAHTEGALTEVGGDEDLMATLMTRALLSSIDYTGNVYVVWVPG
ncbi:substrate-binding domain-containing protein, partial [Methylocapsa sp. S129]|uniref:sugar ABC transporter substrate-binding protein n=1 Tax=Methylocapsa sp. S129 TaxID=1641869 RepID=UPI00131D1767